MNRAGRPNKYPFELLSNVGDSFFYKDDTPTSRKATYIRTSARSSGLVCSVYARPSGYDVLLKGFTNENKTAD